MVCSSVAIPASEVPEVVIPAGRRRVQLVGFGHDAETIDDWDDRVVTAYQVVEAYEQRRPLDRIEFTLRRSIGLVVGRVPPPRDISALPLVLLSRNFPRRELAHEHVRIGLRHIVLVHLDVRVEVRIGIGIGDVGGEEHRFLVALARDGASRSWRSAFAIVTCASAMCSCSARFDIYTAFWVLPALQSRPRLVQWLPELISHTEQQFGPGPREPRHDGADSHEGPGRRDG